MNPNHAQPGSPKLMDCIRQKMRLLHLSKRTEEAYLGWIRRFLLFAKAQHGHWTHPSSLGNQDIEAFLTQLAVDRNVSASTQNQAFSALLFLFQKVLNENSCENSWGHTTLLKESYSPIHFTGVEPIEIGMHRIGFEFSGQMMSRCQKLLPKPKRQAHPQEFGKPIVINGELVLERRTTVTFAIASDDLCLLPGSWSQQIDTLRDLYQLVKHLIIPYRQTNCVVVSFDLGFGILEAGWKCLRIVKTIDDLDHAWERETV